MVRRPVKSLIVNADDFNFDRERSLGILEAARQGIVTSVTVMTSRSWDQGLTDQLKATFNGAIGVHLNLSEGRPLVAGATSLTDSGGMFFPKTQAWRRALSGGYHPAEVEAEWRAQIEMAFSRGIVPSHLDGHNHLHVFPGLAEVVARLARRFGIQRVRLPVEGLWGRPGHRGIKGAFLRRLAMQARPVLSGAGLVFPEHFAGIHWPRPGRVEELLELLRALPAGTTELMCHPGYAAARDGAGFSSSRREEELAALTNPVVLDEVRRQGIRLVSFADLPVKNLD